MQAAIPIGASLLAPEMAPMMGAGMAGLSGVAASEIPAWLSSAASGALLGGLGSYAMGQNPLMGMLTGGIGSGLSGAIGLNDKMGSLFGGGINPESGDVAGALSSTSPSQFANAPDVNIGSLNNSFDPSGAAQSVNSQFASGLSSPSTSASSGFWDSKLGKFLPYAGIGAAALLTDNMMAPKQVGPNMKDELQSRPVRPMDREYTSVDPNSFYGIGGNRSFFNQINPGVRYFANGGSSYGSSQNIPVMGRRKITGHVNGPGTGTSDSIPAMLSDGEHVVTEKEVTKLGGGNNAKGQKKMYDLRKKIRGGGLGNYAMAH